MREVDASLSKGKAGSEFFEYLMDLSAAQSKLIQTLDVPMLPPLGALQDSPYVRELQKAMVDAENALAGFRASMEAQFGRAAKWFQDNRENLENLQKAIPRFDKALESSGEIGHLGWTVSENMELPVILKLSECADATAADAYMLTYYEMNDPDIRGIEERLGAVEYLDPFSISIDQSFSAFRSGHFALVIPLLIAVLELSLRQWETQKPFPATDMKRTVLDRYDLFRKDERIAFSMRSIVSFTKDHYENFNARTSDSVRLFRNGVMHGLQAPPNEKIQAIRLYHVIDTVAELNLQMPCLSLS